MVCSLDISNLILIATLAMDMMNRLKNTGDKINSISNRQSIGLSGIPAEWIRSFSWRYRT